VAPPSASVLKSSSGSVAPKILISNGRRSYSIGIDPRVCMDLIDAEPVQCALAE